MESKSGVLEDGDSRNYRRSNGPGEEIYSYDDTPLTLLSLRPSTILATPLPLPHAAL